MGKARVCSVSLLCMVFCLYTVSAGVSAKKETHLSSKGSEYEAYRLELENYRLQSAMRKDDMERAYGAWVLSNSEDSFQTWKEAELVCCTVYFQPNNAE